MISWPTVRREIKVQFRSAWTLSLAVAYSLFISIILYVSADAAGLGLYTKTTGTLMNLMGYFLPLMTLLMGAFSFTMEKEDGSWMLLSTYPLSSTAWILGKLIGIFVVLMTIMTFAFSVGGILSYVWQPTLTFAAIASLYLYAAGLIALFLVLAVFIGVLSRNRWQALTICVTIWVLFVLAWPILLLSVLHALPYQMSLQLLQIATIINPAEFTRIYFTIQMGGGHIFGPQYVEWVTWAQRPESVIYFIGFFLIWLVLSASASVYLLERSRRHGSRSAAQYG